MKNCLFCKSNFEPGHGNQEYCCEEHKKLQKAANQYKFYKLFKEFRLGFINNYKIFQRILAEKNTKSLPLSKLYSEGFRPNCYYGKSQNDKMQVFYWVGNFSFSLYKEKGIEYIKIFKL